LALRGNKYINNVVIEKVEQLTYLGSVVNGDRGTLQDVKAWIKKANGIFIELCPLCKNKNIL
jgi:hypothetical protein